MPRGKRGTQVNYECPRCGFNTSNKTAFNRHMNRENPCETGRVRGKRTTEHVIEYFRKVHGTRYLYDKFVYEGDRDAKGIIICRCHGEFSMSSHNHQRGQNCHKCSSIRRSRNIIHKYRATCITKFKEIHGDKYDYSQVVYKLGRENVTIICPTHGSFLQTPENHWRGQGCPTCGILKCANSKKYTREGIIARFRERWPPEEFGYSYEKFEYVDCNTSGIMTCPKHGDFLQTARNHLDNRNVTGCFQCSNELSGLSNNSTLESFIQKARSKHGDKFDYSMVKYVRSTTEIKIICPNHGEQIQTPYYHINGKHGCVLCANESIGEKMKISVEIFLEKCTKRFGDMFDYSDCGYVDTYTKFKPRCIKHNKTFDILPHGHLKSDAGGCQSCCTNGVSKKQLQWLQYEQDKVEYYIQNHMSEKREYKIPGVGKVDGYCHETNTVYEFHGIFWHGHPDFFDPNVVHPCDKSKTYGEKYQNTLARDKKIQTLGYNLVIMWEHEWDEINSDIFCQSIR